tara:strand:- start:13436 stop:14254 length:819 start_codon:yes stop_codon:yes gene_type:complete
MNLNDLRKKHQELISGKMGGGEGGGDKYLKVEPGKNIIRILPWKDENKEFYSEAMIHRYTDSEGKIQNYYCRKQQPGETCPLCELYFDLWKMHKALNLPKGVKSQFGDMATKIKPTPRYYMNVISRKALEEKGEDIAGALKIFSTGVKVFKKVIDHVFNEDFRDEADPDNTTVLSLKKGNDFILELGKSGEFNNYDNSVFRNKKTAAGSDREVKVWMDALHDIHSLIKISEYEEGKNVVDSLLASLNTVGAPDRSAGDEDMGESKFNKEVQV